MHNHFQLLLVTQVFFVLGLLMGCQTSNAAQFQVSDANYSVCDKLSGESKCIAIRLSGAIMPGDAAKLEDAIKTFEAAGSSAAKTRVAALFLHSPGGSVAEAMKIGRTARALQLWTQVGVNDRCASSCTLVLAGGVARFPLGIVEVHSFYSPEILGTGDFSKAEKMYTEVADRIAAYLKEMRVPSALLDEMMLIPHYSSRKLELEEVKRLGLFGIDPVYAQIRPQPKPQRTTPNRATN